LKIEPGQPGQKDWLTAWTRPAGTARRKIISKSKSQRERLRKN
jgi:hypothetical protein